MPTWSKHAERLLWSTGGVAMVYAGLTQGRASYEQARGEAELSKQITQVSTASKNISEGDLFGRLEIPSLNLAAIIFEGTTDSTLAQGIGHLSGSANQSDVGNVVLAAHRDTFFRPLKRIAVNDKVLLRTYQGTSTYRVIDTFVVKPESVEVIQPTKEAVLTLITCYPFSYLGSAPERFVVRAVLEP